MFKNRIEYGLALFYDAVLFLFYHNFFFFFLLLTVLVVPFASYFVTRRVWANLKVNIETDVVSITENNDVVITFITENATRFPLPAVTLDFTVYNRFYPNSEIQTVKLPVRPGKNTFTWSVSSVYAGRMCIDGKEITLRDYLGIKLFKKEWDSRAAVSVFPSLSEVIMDVVEDTFTPGNEEELNSENSSEDVTQIKQFREYVPGDRIQRINWKISLKQDSLFVKEYEREFNRSLTLLTELCRDSDNAGFLDEILTAVYSAASKLADMDIFFSIGWYDTALSQYVSEPVSNEDSLIDAFERMFLADSYTDYPAFDNYQSFEKPASSSAIYFTSVDSERAKGFEPMGIYKEKVALICL